MSEEILVPSTPEEHMKLSTIIFKLPSDIVVQIKAMDPESGLNYITLMDVPEEERPVNQGEVVSFVRKHLVEIRDNIVMPNIIAPKVPARNWSIFDIGIMFTELAVFSGFAKRKEDEREKFPDEGDSSEPT